MLSSVMTWLLAGWPHSICVIHQDLHITNPGKVVVSTVSSLLAFLRSDWQWVVSVGWRGVTAGRLPMHQRVAHTHGHAASLNETTDNQTQVKLGGQRTGTIWNWNIGVDMIIRGGIQFLTFSKIKKNIKGLQMFFCPCLQTKHDFTLLCYSWFTSERINVDIAPTLQILYLFFLQLWSIYNKNMKRRILYFDSWFPKIQFTVACSFI